MILKSPEEIRELRQKVYDNGDAVCRRLQDKIRNLPSAAFLAEVKFDPVGYDPVRGGELNFIEQLNQMFSDLVVLDGTERLMESYPDKEWRLCLGPASGFDIESTDGAVVAECFAVTTVMANRKLENDCVKLMEKAKSQSKYIFFYSRRDSGEKVGAICARYPEITVVRIEDFNP